MRLEEVQIGSVEWRRSEQKKVSNGRGPNKKVPSGKDPAMQSAMA